MTDNNKAASEVIVYNKSHYGDLISEARRKAGMTQQQLASELGISKNIVTHWEAGRVKPDLNLIPQLCRSLQITLEDFFRLPLHEGGLTLREQQMLTAFRSLSSRDKLIIESALQKTVELNQADLWQRCKEDFVSVFRNSQTAAAGTAALLDGEEGTRVYVRKNRASLRAREIVTVNGDSMRPRYKNGEDVYVEDASDLRIGEIGIFVVNGVGYIKQRQIDRLHSLNPAYPDILLNDTDDVICYGRVLSAVPPEDYPSPEEQAVLEEIEASQVIR